MEQRVGRIDRVRSQTERRLTSLTRPMTDEDKLQVYLPHLQDTVEVLQVRCVLDRMNTFLRLMHEGLIFPGHEKSTVSLNHEAVANPPPIPQIQQELKSAFPCDKHLNGDPRKLEVDSSYQKHVQDRFLRLKDAPLEGLHILWDSHVSSNSSGRLVGTATLRRRIQPFMLLLKSIEGRLLVRCISPVGRVSPGNHLESIQDTAARKPIRLGAILTAEVKTYDLTVEEDVLLGACDKEDAKRVATLIRRVVDHADFEERVHLPGHDEPLPTFKSQLLKEGVNEN
jgi:hypothetical protein